MPSLTCLSWSSKCCDEVNDKDNSHTTWEAAGVIQVKVSLRNGIEAFVALLRGSLIHPRFGMASEHIFILVYKWNHLLGSYWAYCVGLLSPFLYRILDMLKIVAPLVSLPSTHITSTLDTNGTPCAPHG
jgi:hypothetical protein